MKILEKYSINPGDEHLYELAFIHESYAHENNLDECYQRLEFLGDAVLDLVVSEYLYRNNPHLSEGELTRIRANYVCRQALYTYSLELEFDQYLKIGAGIDLSIREMDSIISDVFESFTGALYLDQGLSVVRDFLSKTVIPHIESNEIFFYDYKSELKEMCDARALDVIYKLVSEEGEPHSKVFTMTAVINGKSYGTGTAGSKKEAQQRAAKKTLNMI
ncbi:MAG: ribonuclease III [Methanomicrobiales archaeon]